MFSFSRQVTSHSFKFPLFCALFAALLLLVLPITGGAQSSGGTDSLGTGGKNTIQGRIYFPSGRQADVRAKVSLESMTFSSLSVLADTDGAFRFRNLAPGSYAIVIDAGGDYEPVREPVFLDGNSSLGRSMNVPMPARVLIVPIHLQFKRGARAGLKTGVLNAALANVPKAAADLYLEALDAVRANNNQKAGEQLRAAVSIYPEFALALNELGVHYLKLGQADKAAAVLRTAVKVAPNDFTPRLNYGIALLEKKLFIEAQTELRRALTITETSRAAHLYLGIALINLQKYDDAEKELQQAAAPPGESIGLAHYYLGGLFWRRQEYKRAARELEIYLKLTPKATNAEQVRETIKQLRAK